MNPLILTQLAKNLSGFAITTIPYLVGTCDILSYASVENMVYQNLTSDEEVVIRQYSYQKKIDNYSESMNEKAKPWSDYIPLGDKFIDFEKGFESKDIIDAKKEVYTNIKCETPDEIKRIKSIIYKSMAICDYFALVATGEVKIICGEDITSLAFPELSEEDKKFYNALAKHFWPKNSTLLLEGVEDSNLDDYNISNVTGNPKWNKDNLITNKMIKRVARKINESGVSLDAFEELDIDNMAKEAADISFKTGKNEKGYISPIIFGGRDAKRSPFIFLNVKDMNKSENIGYLNLSKAGNAKAIADKSFEYKVLPNNKPVKENPSKVKAPFDYKSYKLPEGFVLPNDISEDDAKIILGTFDYIGLSDEIEIKITHVNRNNSDHLSKLPIKLFITNTRTHTNSVLYADTGMIYGGNRRLLLSKDLPNNTYVYDVLKSPASINLTNKFISIENYIPTDEEIKSIYNKYLSNYNLVMYKFLDLSDSKFIGTFTDDQLNAFYENVSRSLSYITSTYGSINQVLKLTACTSPCDFSLRGPVFAIDATKEGIFDRTNPDVLRAYQQTMMQQQIPQPTRLPDGTIIPNFRKNVETPLYRADQNNQINLQQMIQQMSQQQHPIPHIFGGMPNINLNNQTQQNARGNNNQ